MIGVRCAAGHAQVAQRFVVDREEAGGGAVFGRHVGDRGAISQWQSAQPGSEELDKTADDAEPAQHLRDAENQVGGGRALLQLAGQLDADDFRHQLVERLTQQNRLGLDPADAPTEHPQSADHGRVRVSSDQGIRKGEHLAVDISGRDHAGQVLEIDLVDDAGAGRHDAEVLHRLLRPAQERVSLAVSLVFQLDIAGEGHQGAEVVDLHRVIDDQIDRNQRIDRATSPPMRATADRIAARSTTQGTPVKSWKTTRPAERRARLPGASPDPNWPVW